MTPQITEWHWIGFVLWVVAALAIDLGIFHRDGRSVSLREALAWTTLWVTSAFVFAWLAAPRWIPNWSSQNSATFLTGYIVELCLSMDNVFVIAILFRFFSVPAEWQHRILFWGILGALLMRGLMIAAGAVVVSHWGGILYLMGAFLVWTGIAMLLGRGPEADTDVSKNWVVRISKKWLPISSEFDGERLTTRRSGRWMLTPLALVLLVVETTDVAFALDSIPAIFGITREPFIVFTSNVFAILGLRSLYFVLASVMDYFRLLKHGLAVVLVLIGTKMLLQKPLDRWLGDQVTVYSMSAVLGILVVLILGSVLLKFLETKRPETGRP